MALLATLGGIATVLTLAMFLSRQMMLGFPCAIFWAVMAGQAYTLSSSTWDIYYLMFFAGIGMTIWAMYAMYALRTRVQDMTVGDTFIDEAPDIARSLESGGGKGKPATALDDDDEPGRLARGVRERAARRRTHGIRRKTDWGEFN